GEVARRGDGGLSAGVDDEQDRPGAGHGVSPGVVRARSMTGSAAPASRRSRITNSPFPAGPGSRLATTPAVPHPRSAAPAATRATAAARTSGSRTTPPLPT